MTSALIFGYWLFISLFGLRATSAETNIAAGLIRLHGLSELTETSIVMVGTSITAKLEAAGALDRQGDSIINMGIDGGTSLYAAQKIASLEIMPRVIVVEANAVLMPLATSNLNTLDRASDNAYFKLAKHIEVLRAEYRPVSVLYSLLKRLKDNFAAVPGSGPGSGPALLRMEQKRGEVKYPPRELAHAMAWRHVIEYFRRNGVKVFFAMLPDGSKSREEEYAFTRKLVAEYGLGFLDVKQHTADMGLSYSDGLHLATPSAKAVFQMLLASLDRFD
jgi:hypothetical protein